MREWIDDHPRRAIAILLTAAFLIVAFVPQLRRVTVLAASRVALVLATPIAPSIRNFSALPQPTHLVASDGSLLATVSGGELRDPVQLNSLPDHVKHAALAAEDQNFYSHGGIDPEGVTRAALRNLRGHREGGSTITQQLAKLNYAGSRRTLFRKVREALYALKLEQKYSKDQLLERYLNQVYFGDGAYGIAAASAHTFGVPPDKLTPAQAALLTGRIRGPASRNPRTHAEAAVARRNVVLKLMRKRGWLTKEAFQQALADPLTLAPKSPAAGVAKAPHFVEFVKREVGALDALGGSPEVRAHQLASGGLTIETTFDPRAFDSAEAAVRAKLGAPGDPAAAVVSVVPGDGAIRSIFGGIGFDRKFDLATQGHRQTGSSFKTFVYLAALRAGIDPRSVFNASSPMTLNYKGHPYTVNNYEGESSGPTSVEEGLVHSINTVFAQLVLQPGVQPGGVVQNAIDAGIPAQKLERDRDRPSVALGGLTGGVSPLDMASAYATFAAKGVRSVPFSVVRVRDRHGREIYHHDPERTQAIDQNVAGVVNGTLLQVVERGTGTAARVPGWTVGGKTGTTQRFGDAWFIGITDQMSTAVWVGYPDAVRPMNNVHGRQVTGGSFPAEIFSQAMQGALAGRTPTPLFTAPIESLALTPAVGATTLPPPTLPIAPPTLMPPPPDPMPPPEPPPTQPPESSTTRRSTTSAPPPSSSSSTTQNTQPKKG